MESRFFVLFTVATMGFVGTSGGIGSHAIAKEKESIMKASMVEAVPLSKKEKSVIPLFKSDFKVMGVGLIVGQKLEKHQTPTPAFLFIQEGRVLYTIGDQKIELKAGDYLTIPPKEMHEIEALDDSRLLLMK